MVRKPLQPDSATADVYSVSRLNREARRLLEGGLQGCWVAGEISNLAQPGSGHLYFTLKDAEAQVRCAMFRSAQRYLRFRPADGAQVIVQGTVSIYEARGSYQIIAERMEEAGEGLLRRQFEELKQRLHAAGLFASEHKIALPALPRCIGIVSSPTGAAVRDILQVLNRRYPAAHVILYPTRVQGDGARDEIAAAIRRADARAECDVLIVGRGGGSLEDLWCFNEEIVARAIYDCRIPIVSAVGHEIDATISDLVADQRAPTPSAAAELVVPDIESLLRALEHQRRQLGRAIRQRLQSLTNRQTQLESRLHRVHPGTVLQQRQQRVDELLRRLLLQTRRSLHGERLRLQHLHTRLQRDTPLARIRISHEHQLQLGTRLVRAMQQRLERASARLAYAGGQLHAVSPLATLERGYAIVRDANGQVVRTSEQIRTGDQVQVRLAHGELEAEVRQIRKQ